MVNRYNNRGKRNEYWNRGQSAGNGMRPGGFEQVRDDFKGNTGQNEMWQNRTAEPARNDGMRFRFSEPERAVRGRGFSGNPIRDNMKRGPFSTITQDAAKGAPNHSGDMRRGLNNARGQDVHRGAAISPTNMSGDLLGTTAEGRRGVAAKPADMRQNRFFNQRDMRRR